MFRYKRNRSTYVIALTSFMTCIWCELKCLQVAFSKDDSIPETGKAVIENKLLAEAVLESIIGKNGVSPGARLSVAERLAQLMKENKVEEDATKTDQEEANDLSLAKEN